MVHRCHCLTSHAVQGQGKAPASESKQQGQGLIQSRECDTVVSKKEKGTFVLIPALGPGRCH